MKVDRIELLRSVKAASLVADPKHSIPLFTKVWLMSDYVLAFNANGLVIQAPAPCFAAGGVEGKVLAELLDSMEDDDIELTAGEQGQLIIKSENSTTELSVLEYTESVAKLSKVPDMDEAKVIEFDVALILGDIELDAMMQLNTMTHDPNPTFTSVILSVIEGKARLFASDRGTINVTNGLEIEAGQDCQRYLPLEFLKVLVKSADLFEDGTILCDEKNVVAVNDEGIGMFCRIPHIPAPVNFQHAVSRVWPNAKPNAKAFVEVPHNLKELAEAAKMICKDEEDAVKLTVSNGTLGISTRGRNGAYKFSGSTEFDHPKAEIKISVKRLLQAIKHADKMTILSQAIVFRGPNKFWRYVASKA